MIRFKSSHEMLPCLLFRRNGLKQITIQGDRFGFEPGIIAKVGRLAGRIYEALGSYCSQTNDEREEIGRRGGIGALRRILNYNLFAWQPDS
jgi:hypothetical protein